MLNVQPTELVTWLHVLAMATAGGGAITALLLSGLEDAQPEYRGLAAAIWSRVVVWGTRLAVVFGVILLVLKLREHYPLFTFRAFHLKLTAAILMAGLAEMSTKTLAKGKKGAALLMLVLFLVTTFAALNRSVLGFSLPKAAPATPAVMQPGK